MVGFWEDPTRKQGGSVKTSPLQTMLNPANTKPHCQKFPAGVDIRTTVGVQGNEKKWIRRPKKHGAR